MKFNITFLSTLLILTLGCSKQVAPVTKAQIQKSIKINDPLYPMVSPRVQSLMDKMTVEEKIGQLNLLTPGGTVTGEVVSKNVEEKIKKGQVGGIFGIRGADKVYKAQKIAVNESRLGIPILIGMDVIHGHQTIAPIPLGLSCSWDMELIESVARMAAEEATADGIMWAFSPIVDIARDPRWGRISEGSGEDPFLGSAIAKTMVKGYQGNDLTQANTMLACVKHFALYGAAEGGRDYMSVDMSKLKMFNEYLPPYKAAIDAGCGSVMTSFNVIDYDPASGNDELYNGVLRTSWGFKDLVVTDYTAVSEMVYHGVGNLEQVSKKSLLAGVDMDMVSEGFLSTLKKSLDQGKIKIEDIDRACARVLMAKEKLGLFDDPYRYGDKAKSEYIMLSEAHRTLAKKAATSSMVLLKNSKNILPLQKNAKIALIGPLADSRRNMLGTWSVSGDHTKAVTLIEGLKTKIGSSNKVLYAKGANISDDRAFAKRVNAFGEEITIDTRTPDEMIEEALNIAKSADVIVAAVGEAADMSGEASSMADIGLQPSQKKLLEALKTTGKPIVLVLFNGQPMTLAWEDKNMDAILDVWFAGTESGNAITDVLFGDSSPGGRLTTSFPQHVGQIPVYHSMLNTGRPDDGSRPKFKSNYLDIPNEPLYPFGFGLTYTNFLYGKPTVSQNTLSPNQKISISVNVTNTGSKEGSEVVQLYIRDVVGSISRPMKELKGFKKISLIPNETKTVTFEINEELLTFYNKELQQVVEPGDFEIMVGPNSKDIEKVTIKYNK